MKTLLMCLVLCATPAQAGVASDIAEAQVALDSGDHEGAVRSLRVALKHPDEVKERSRALGFTLLGEGLLSMSSTVEAAGGDERSLRDLQLEAMAAGHQALAAPQVQPGVTDRARKVVGSARRTLWGQALVHAAGEHPGSASWWIDGLQRVEGETLETLSLKAIMLAHQGERSSALRAFQAATLTAEQAHSEIRTPTWGVTYLEYARLVVGDETDEKGVADAIVLLERGLAWHVRASTPLGAEHHDSLRSVRRKIEAARLQLLILVPARDKEALYAMEAILTDNLGNVEMLADYRPWLEEHYPQRALSVYEQAQLARPKDPVPRYFAGVLLVRQAATLRAGLRTTSDADARGVLTLRIEGLLRDARGHLGTAYERDRDNIDVVQQLANVCRELGDVDAAQHWSAKLKALRLR